MLNIIVIAKLLFKMPNYYQDAKDAYLMLNYIYKVLPLIKYLRKRVQLAEPFMPKLLSHDDII